MDSDGALILAPLKFPGLIRAERAMLEYSQAGNVERKQFAVAGTSANPDDPSNDPKEADGWDKGREVRATLIRWLCEDPEALHLVGPSGVAVMGVRIDIARPSRTSTAIFYCTRAL